MRDVEGVGDAADKTIEEPRLGGFYISMVCRIRVLYGRIVSFELS